VSENLGVSKHTLRFWEKELRGILAKVYARLGRNEERLEQFRILEEKGLLDGTSIYNKALAEEEMGRYPEAVIDYNRFIRKGLAPETKVEDRIKLHQAVNLTLAGAVGGSFWGMLIGLLFLNPLVGMAVGAGAGAISGKLTDIGIDDNMMKDLAASFMPGNSALFVLVRKVTGDKVLERLKPFAGKGKVFKTSLSKDKEETLRSVLEHGNG
jgi:uncharacterized membrane protein